MSNKEPWLAVNLSKILPGLGQIYTGKKSKGYFLILITITLNILTLWVVLSPTANVITSGAGILGTIFILWLWNLFDAYRSAKSKNTPEFETLRKQSKDPWLAMFLSQLFLGIGHFYIGKWFLGILAIVLIVIVSFFSRLLASILLAYIAYLAYVFSPVRREPTKDLALTIAIIIGISSWLSIGLGFFLRTYVVEARWTPSGAMEPTLHGTPNQWEADRILVNKFSYRFEDPKRGDIIVFLPTENLKKQQYTDAFIKRIVGLSGEKVELRNGQVYINSQPLKEDKYLTQKQRTLIDVCLSGLEPPYLAKPVTIPPESYLVLGDNRENSYDSRCWGVVPRNLIIGKAYKIFFPLDHVGSI
ncbi:MAG: signal peptidase I [Desmonostoc vinosum HA7617-LM4]|jgi:signal peptidase I|nr:signal peptidase I [Desmonostoc vinosum HA7617-LM4]